MDIDRDREIRGVSQVPWPGFVYSLARQQWERPEVKAYQDEMEAELAAERQAYASEYGGRD